ncbi:hypothetical protein EIN_153820 [Entamoeba invadens IP1]|uniref:START domain-containing protein n=1 Tax=Entamoeba invadens IP1 TaxID=370355 RepID=A0A0A1U8V0_ENTIV|nr:hypothetical protein EIN_153820 [Entamoeba invadens IP1]ELP91345.1 hypothetical protein EIN_153820 [Entamoeba invadens IP1]|eukprot:XP_004258116.1 hypothetical protein EIN_153820 [Entamoeba invadens IP1]
MATIQELQTCSTEADFKTASDTAKKWFADILAENWTETSKGDVQVYDKPSNNYHHFILTKTDSKLTPQAFFEKVTKATVDEIHNYDKGLVSNEVIEKIGDINVTKQVNSAPWPVAAREFISVELEYEENGVYYIISRSINYPKCDTVGKGYVRGLKFFGMKFTPKEGGCSIERVLEVDPKGSVVSIAVSSSKKEDATRLANMKKYFESH